MTVFGVREVTPSCEEGARSDLMMCRKPTSGVQVVTDK